MLLAPRMSAPTPHRPDPREGAAARALLRAERDGAAERLAALQRDWTRIVESSTSVATDDEHDPEGATIAFERAQLETLLEQARRQLGDLDEATQRVQAGTYGICESCGERIASERLAARPAARTCISCASARR
ncbi:MAG: DnaK suppressor protein [Actinomycetota bacterium]|jgi:DnaK suppressor protein|nr:DnaK suppressor protein [Actinomycetota bacterium]MDQ1669279.1 DnaK suppressor protein [Actinomycetota bacterium]